MNLGSHLAQTARDRDAETARRLSALEAMTPAPRPDLLTVRTDSAAMQQQQQQQQQQQTLDESTEELSSIMLASLPLHANPASDPASPGASTTVPLQDASGQAMARGPDFSPPERPSSTPFPHPDRRNSAYLQDAGGRPGFLGNSTTSGSDWDDKLHGIRRDSQSDKDNGMSFPSPSSPQDYDMDLDTDDESRPSPTAASMTLDDLPAEIHEAILDHLFGYRVSSASKSSLDMHCVTRSWGTVLRHSRRRELSQLALVSPTWRGLIQQRLYRHIKIRATVESIGQAYAFFTRHQHLQHHVKHIELWYPVFERAATPAFADRTRDVRPDQIRDGVWQPPSAPTYTMPTSKCSLQETFEFVKAVLPSVRVLTLEGGERRKAPKVPHHHPYSANRSLTRLETVHTLVTKGQWNLMRKDEDFDSILGALPSLKEWHGSYNRPKSKNYLSISTILPNLPSNITQLHLCLEGEYRRELACPPFFRKVASQLHFCSSLAAAVPALENFSYTGRICKTFLDTLAHKINPRTSRLRYISITARNICRPSPSSETGCGIQDLNFMHVFEMLVLSGIRSLSKLSALEYLRIRYIDLDSPVPPLNPFFLVKNGWVSGVWSESILEEMQRSRCSLRYDEICDDFGEMSLNKDGRMVISPHYPRPRVLGLKLANYALLADGITMHQ